MAPLVLTAVALVALILPSAAQTTTKVPTTTTYNAFPTGNPNANKTYDPWDPTYTGNKAVCHTEPWARVNPDTPNDDPLVQICPCNYPYYAKEQKCCLPLNSQEGQQYNKIAPYFYGAAGATVAARKSSVNGKMLCPCGYALNATDNICYTYKSGKYEDQCPCGTIKSAKNGACYDPSETSGIEEWGECVSSPWNRAWPKELQQDGKSNSLCPCGYYYKPKSNSAASCCKLKGAQSPYYYGAAYSVEGPRTEWPKIGGRVDAHGVNKTRLCPCGYYLDKGDNYCYSIKQYKYEDPCPCGWAKHSETKACFFNNYDYGYITK
jgi:hypothetical protein